MSIRKSEEMMEAQIALDLMGNEDSQPLDFDCIGPESVGATCREDEGIACVRERLLSEREHFRQMTRLAVMPDMATVYSDECALREKQLDQLFPSWRSRFN